MDELEDEENFYPDTPDISGYLGYPTEVINFFWKIRLLSYLTGCLFFILFCCLVSYTFVYTIVKAGGLSP
jgi:hypothetical protein